MVNVPDDVLAAATKIERLMIDDPHAYTVWDVLVMAIIAERARNKWQPIETAPKDGTHILIHYKNWLGCENLVVSAYYDENEETWIHVLGSGDADNWQPLPEPPTA